MLVFASHWLRDRKHYILYVLPAIEYIALHAFASHVVLAALAHAPWFADAALAPLFGPGH